MGRQTDKQSDSINSPLAMFSHHTQVQLYLSLTLTCNFVKSNQYIYPMNANCKTTAVALWLERPPCEWEVPDATDQSLKLVVVAFPIGAQDYGNSTTTGPRVSG